MNAEKGIRLAAMPLDELRAGGVLPEVMRKFDWFYLGAEFCENLLPEPGELCRSIRFFLAEGKKVCLLTPPLTEKGAAALKEALSAVAGLKRPRAALELTVNDFGALQLARELRLDIKINAGRLLYDNLFRFRDRSLTLLNRYALHFFTAQGVDRFELPASGWRPRTNFGRAGEFGFRLRDFHLTLYYPYLNLTTSRACLTGMPEPSPHEPASGISCARECSAAAFELSHPLIREKLIVRGNTIFLRFPKKFYASGKDLSALRIDRLVYCPFP